MSVSFEKLQDIAKVIDSLHKTPKYSETGYSMVRCTDVKYGFLNLQGTFKVSKAIFDEFSKRYEPSRNDIVITRVGTYGVTALVQDTEFCLGQNTSVIIAKKINPKYLYAVLNSPILKNQIEASVVGSTQKTLSLKAINNFEIPRFSPEVEDQIAKMISELDEKIHLNNRINQTLESIAQAIFKSWFIDFEPVRAKIAAKQEGKDAELAAMCIVSGKSEAELQQIPEEDFAELQATAALFPDEFVESELGEVPKEWEVKPLDKIANYLNGLALQKFRPENEYDFLPIVKIAQLKSGVATIEEKASPNIDRKFIIENGDVIFSWSGSLMVDIWCGGKAALNQHLFKVTSNDYHKWLYYFYTKHHLAEFQRIAQAKAVTMGHIKREHLSQALCCIASNQLLEISNIFIGHFLQKLIELRLENNNLKQLRDTLLPKLLSGEVEVENL